MPSPFFFGDFVTLPSIEWASVGRFWYATRDGKAWIILYDHARNLPTLYLADLSQVYPAAVSRSERYPLPYWAEESTYGVLSYGT